MIRQVPNRFNPAQIIKLATSPADRFSAQVSVRDFKRLTQLVGDYRLSGTGTSAPDSASDDCTPDAGQEVQAATVVSSEHGSEGGFEAVFALSQFSDSSFILDTDEQVAKPGASLPGGGKSAGKSGYSSGGSAEERAAKTPIIVAEGTMEAIIVLQCQRCLGDYNHRLHTEFKFAFAANEVTAELLPDSMDPVLLDDEGNISVVDMFEDELLLRLPTHAAHPEESQCDFNSVPYLEHVATEEQLAKLAEESKPENPFASLKGMSFSASSGENGDGQKQEPGGDS